MCHKPNPGFDSTRFADHIAPSVPVCGKACEAKYLHSKELKPVVGGKVAQQLSDVQMLVGVCSSAGARNLVHVDTAIRLPVIVAPRLTRSVWNSCVRRPSRT